MQNRDIAKIFRLTAQLLELHEENPFKIKSYTSAAFKIDTAPVQLGVLSLTEMEKIDGIGKSLSTKIAEIIETGSLSDLENLLKITPEGVLDILKIKGIGPKKVRILWKELGVESSGELLYACIENRLIELKGFGEKTQEQIKKSIEFSQANSGKFLYANILPFAESIVEVIKTQPGVSITSLTGAIRRKCEIIEHLDIIIGSQIPPSELISSLKELLNLENISTENLKDLVLVNGNDPNGINLNIYISALSSFYKNLFFSTGTPEFFSQFNFDTNSIEDISEEDIFIKAGINYLPPELREGVIAREKLIRVNEKDLIEYSQLKGVLHNHSTYSDGINTLKEMAEYCKDDGFEYFGICDHSKSAFYAGGLKPEKIIQQHLEIEELNKKMAPFKIFKGIESDILNDGSLDYEPEVLDTFDFVVASIHSNLKMTEEKATSRLIKAIENPYTTIIGHPTGRLLLSRQGYPIDHKKVIEACAANNVIIELNANPHRLDIDWKWIDYIMEKNIMISINPDAHRKEAIRDMQFGIYVARKGGLTKNMTFNALSKEAIEIHFNKKKAYV